MKNRSENIITAYIYSFLVVFASIPVLIFSRTPPFADDYSWLNFLAGKDFIKIGEIFSSTDPFGFYRPLFVILFKTFFTLFGANYLLLRIFSALLNVLITITVYKLLYPGLFSKSESFFSALLFSVMASHSEVLYIANCINILLSDLFILLGIFAFIKCKKPASVILPPILFFLSLLLRESSVYYILFLIIFYYYFHRNNFVNLVLSLILPLILYGSILFLTRPSGYGSFFGKVGGLDFNMGALIYKPIHFFLISILPLKLPFYFLGFRFYDDLREMLTIAGNRYLLPYAAVIAFFLGLILGYFIVKKLKFRIIFPVLFFLSGISVYIAGIYVAERFTFIASLGTSLIVVMYFSEFENKKLGFLFIFLLICLNLYTLLLRGETYREYSLNFAKSINELHSIVIDDSEKSDILILGLPASYKGQILVSALNFNDVYRYFYPTSNKTFYLMNCLSNEEKKYSFSQTFRFDPLRFSYSP